MRYEIKGEPLPVVICSVENGETLISESGAMSWMSTNMEMSTVGGGIGKALGRMFSGENLFQNHFTARGGPGVIAFSSSFPGSLRAVEIGPGREIIVQKSSFLASEKSVELSVYMQKKLKTGIFGGEGFIMQKLSGRGIAFLEIDGSAVEYDLAAGQQLLVSTGHVAMMDATCTMEAQANKGVKNALFGGEGFFNTLVTGPGHVILQTMPMSNFAAAVGSMLPSSN